VVQSDKDSKEDIGKVFNLFDDDKSGKISLRNLKRVARELGETMSDAELMEMIERADTDEDGEINPDEFYAIMCVVVAVLAVLLALLLPPPPPPMLLWLPMLFVLHSWLATGVACWLAVLAVRVGCCNGVCLSGRLHGASASQRHADTGVLDAVVNLIRLSRHVAALAVLRHSCAG
jgi:hypothetical protein